MLHALRENWPIVAFLLGASGTLLTIWTTLLWKTATNVTLATKTLGDHAVLLGEHKATAEKLREAGHDLEVRLAVLEDARTHTADTGKHPAMHVRSHGQGVLS